MRKHLTEMKLERGNKFAKELENMEKALQIFDIGWTCREGQD